MSSRPKYILAAIAVAVLGGCAKTGKAPALTSAKIAEGLSLTYWVSRPENRYAISAPNVGALEMYEYLEEETGVHLEFIYPLRSSGLADLQKRLDGGDLPDLIEWNWLTSYPGGPDGAIADGVIVALDTNVRQHAPNYTRLLLENPELAKYLVSEEGHSYGFPFIKAEDTSRSVVGPVFREAWLEDTGQTIPATIEEWQSVLWAFKQHDFSTMGDDPEYPFYMISFTPTGSDEAIIPFLSESNIFAGAFGTSYDFYSIGEAIRFGPAEPAYEDLLRTLAGWYAEGLINPKITETGRSPGLGIIEALGKAGATIIDLSNMPMLSPLNLVPAPPPSGTVGRGIGAPKTPRYGGGRTVAISTACSTVAEAMQWLDIGYGETGHLLYNYGIPGKTYDYRRGEPVLNDEVLADFSTKSANGLFHQTTLFSTSRGVLGGPYVLSADIFSLYADTAFPSGGISSWQVNSMESPETALLYYPGMSEEYQRIMEPIRRLVTRNFVGFISGQRPIEEFREYQVEISRMGLERAYELLSQANRQLASRRVVF